MSTYDPSTTMNTMMMGNHIFSHFNSRLKSNNTLTDSFLSYEFLNETGMLFIQIFMISMFSGMSGYFSSSLDTIKRFITKLFDRFIFKFLIFF